MKKMIDMLIVLIGVLVILPRLASDSWEEVKETYLGISIMVSFCYAFVGWVFILRCPSPMAVFLWVLSLGVAYVAKN